MRERGLTTTELLLALAILVLVAFLILSGQLQRPQAPTPSPEARSAFDGEALARFSAIQRQAQRYLEGHANLFTWITASDLDLSPTRNWTYSLRRVSALEIAVYAHGRTQNQGRRWRLSIRSDGSASVQLEVP
ncbi:MAG: hypothetical protein RMM30_06935 [Armatimonadota bacterium]|nr:hypothetical protein [Armatimonadota bacterium]MDW8156305.1 hypothetical protein [Armatimonadota bacterium]